MNRVVQAGCNVVQAVLGFSWRDILCRFIDWFYDAYCIIVKRMDGIGQIRFEELDPLRTIRIHHHPRYNPS